MRGGARSSINQLLIHYISMWQQWILALLGLWVIAVPFMGFDTAGLMWTLAITGLAIAVLSVWRAADITPEDRRRIQHS